MEKKITVIEKLNYIQQNLKAPKGQYNKHGSYYYRSCEDIQEAVKPLLGGAILKVSDEMVMLGTPLLGVHKSIDKNGATEEKAVDVGTRFYVKATATLLYNGESESVTAWSREPFYRKGMDESQITGAASSYARKYALNGLFAIDDTKDADATNTHDKTETVKQKPGCITPEQAAGLRRIFADIAPNRTKFGEWMEAKYKAKRFDDVKESRYQELLDDMDTQAWLND